MNIYISSGQGEGKTQLSAFDKALQNAGVSNFNLLILSSIIPKGSTIIRNKFVSDPNEYGHKLYIVRGEMRSNESGKHIGAAIGWYQLPDGRGIFVEHETIGDTREIVESTLKNEVTDSLTDTCNFRNYPIKDDSFNMEMSVMEVKDMPASVLVIATYQSEAWK